MFDDYPQPIFSPCMHRNIKVITKGGMHFTEACVWDDIQDQILCLDCLEVLSETEVRESWAGRGTSVNAEILEK